MHVYMYTWCEALRAPVRQGAVVVVAVVVWPHTSYSVQWAQQVSTYSGSVVIGGGGGGCLVMIWILPSGQPHMVISWRINSVFSPNTFRILTRLKLHSFEIQEPSLQHCKSWRCGWCLCAYSWSECSGAGVRLCWLSCLLASFLFLDVDYSLLLIYSFI